MRAFRPSSFSTPEDYEEDFEQAKAENVEVYAERVAAGLPVFIDGAVPQITVHVETSSRTG